MWRFDEGVTECFDDMLRRSIPQYDVMRDTVTKLARRYRIAGTDIVDLGCSRGEAIAPLVDTYDTTNHFIGIELSKPMLAACRRRFAETIKRGSVEIRELDLRNEYPEARASVTMAILVVQFVPIDYRSKILRNAWKSTIPGGSLIMVEKVIASSADLQTAFVSAYHEKKETSGYSRDEIERKRLALEGVLVPASARWNEEMLYSAGFTEVECFWRWMNFAGWIAVKT
jgi:tRNA (cmo5U34)-methyltransferase